mgnify:CR=1 FL=1
MAQKIEIWFEFASTYSYLTVSRAAPLLEAASVPFAWKPFLLGPIFKAKGWDTSPFNLDKAKGNYMWRDVARRAERFGLPFQRPPIFPMHTVQAARIMTAAQGRPGAVAGRRPVRRDQSCFARTHRRGRCARPDRRAEFSGRRGAVLGR